MCSIRAGGKVKTKKLRNPEMLSYSTTPPDGYLLNFTCVEKHYIYEMPSEFIFDHNYVTDHYARGNRRRIASAWCEETGIAMDVTTDCPCVQFYAGNFIENEKGKNGHVYGKRHGFCLETQVEPNAVNVEGFHSPVLEAGEKYHSVTAYRFYIK